MKHTFLLSSALAFVLMSGSGQYSSSQRLDAEALAEAGIIDQTTADRIAEHASRKHDQIHNRYSSDMSGMTPDERHALYAGFKNDEYGGDSIDTLLKEGIINQEQAAAISAYIGS